ncbi:MAG: hypothetical protein U0165_09470 [Polyangiaceae bacterium]
MSLRKSIFPPANAPERNGSDDEDVEVYSQRLSQSVDLTHEAAALTAAASGAALGATAGSSIGPVGAAVGALVGGALGALVGVGLDTGVKNEVEHDRQLDDGEIPIAPEVMLNEPTDSTAGLPPIENIEKDLE